LSSRPRCDTLRTTASSKSKIGARTITRQTEWASNLGREDCLMKSSWLSGLASAALMMFAGTTLAADLPEACNSYQPAVTGGPTPSPESDIVVIRWLGNANFEFAYKGKVYLFDAYFDRTPRAHKLGFTAADVSKAEAVFVSHAHFDHISDIGAVARQTGAPVVGAPITAETAKKLGVPEKQIVVAKGGESLKFGDATAEIALAQHSTIQPGLTDIYASLYQNDAPPYSEEEKKELARVRSLGTFDPKVITEGTLAYALVLPTGFKAVLVGSAGPITPGVRALAERLGPVDAAIVAYQVHAVADTQIAYTWPFIELFKPKLFLPAHHDANPPAWSISASSRSSTGYARTCRARPSSRRSIVRRSVSPAPARTRAKWCRSNPEPQDHRFRTARTSVF
jgi:L-ascorbate metabolism protein UlaG (beta-lactamase superfamily)